MLKLTFKKALRSKNIRQNNTQRTRRDGIKANFHICPSKINSIIGYGTSEGKKKRGEISCLNVNQINSSEERYNTATRKKGMKSARRRDLKKKKRIIS